MWCNGKQTRVLDYSEVLNANLSPEQAAEWARGTPEEWANESHRIATELVYRDVPANGAPPNLTNDYIESGGVVIDEQLQKAGVRLSVILNRCLNN